MTGAASQKKKKPSTKSKSAASKSGANQPVTLTPKATTAQVEPKSTATPKATIVQPAVPVVATSVLKKPEFIERVVEKTGAKKKDAKLNVEAALAVIAEALLDETDLHLPPLGKIRLIKSKDVGGGAKALTLRMRTMKTEVSE